MVLAGEVRGPALDHQREADRGGARTRSREIGYEQEDFHWQHGRRSTAYIHGQSSDIAQGVDAAGNKDEGAGDQGMMFGYACSETPELMPAPIFYAHAILHSLSEARHAGQDAAARAPTPRARSPCNTSTASRCGATTVVVSTQHADSIEPGRGARDRAAAMSSTILPEGWMCDEEHFYVNPTGRFVIGGPDGDAGVTGRKIIVDTYGGAAPHGGGAFSGKDPTKVDRSAAYAARYLAKNVVAAGLAERCTIQLAYAIGVAKPLSFYVDTAGTGRSTRRSCRACCRS